MASAKNQLQEHCQKQRCELPRYTTTRQQGFPAHDPRFVSRVTVDGVGFEGEARSSKTQAEHAAAAVALLHLQAAAAGTERESLPCSSYRVPEEFSQVYFIDLENVPQAQTWDFPRDAWVLGFLGKCHHNAVGENRARLNQAR